MAAAGEMVAKDPVVQVYSLFSNPMATSGHQEKNCQLVDQNLLVIALVASILLWS